MMSERTRSTPAPSTPGAALTLLSFVLAAGLVAFAAWRSGAASALAAGGVALVSALLGYRFGLASGITRGARALGELHERLVAAEAQVVRERLTALRAPQEGSAQLLDDEVRRREQAEAALAEERKRTTAAQQQAEAQVAEERRRTAAVQQQAEAALAQERGRTQAVQQQAEAQIAEERRKTAAVQQQAEAQIAEERRQRQSASEQAARAQREAERLSSEAARRGDDQKGALREVERLLAPYIERERLLLDLSRLDGTARGGLPDLLDAIARKGNFASIVLADEAGLPLAASRGTRDAESVAATSSLLFTLADRMAECGSPAPLAVLVHDEGNETILHRLFRVEGGRYLLTATGRDRGIVPETLDPALHTIERALARETWSA